MGSSLKLDIQNSIIKCKHYKVMKQQNLISCSIDGSLKIWKDIYNPQKNESIYQNHLDTQLLSLCLMEDWIVLGCRNGNLVMIGSHSDHQQFHSSIHKQQNENDYDYLLIGQDQSVVVSRYDQEQFINIQTFHIHDKQSESHMIFDIKTKQTKPNQFHVLTSGSDSQAILSVLDISLHKVDLQIMKKFKHNDFVRTCIFYRNDLIMTGSDDGSMKVFRIDESTNQQVIQKAHQFAIYDIQQIQIQGKQYILTSGEDYTYQIKLWK